MQRTMLRHLKVIRLVIAIPACWAWTLAYCRCCWSCCLKMLMLNLMLMLISIDLHVVLVAEPFSEEASWLPLKLPSELLLHLTESKDFFVVVERICCFAQDKTHIFCKWLFSEKHVKIECTMYLPRQHRARWRLSTGLHLYRSQQAMGPPLTKLNMVVLSNFWSLSPPLWRV